MDKVRTYMDNWDNKKLAGVDTRAGLAFMFIACVVLESGQDRFSDL